MGVDCCRQQDACCKPKKENPERRKGGCCDDSNKSSGSCDYGKASFSNPLVAVGILGVFIATSWYLLNGRRAALA